MLDEFDQHDLWKDTLLIVNTDHGYMLSEHGWWSKGSMPDYQETMHTPLFLWDPRSGVQNTHRKALVQTIDLAPTLLEFFGVPVPKDMTGKPLREAVASDAPVREYALFGYHGGTLDVTDGRYKLLVMPKPEVECFYEYTLMPTHMRARFSPEELQKAAFVDGFSFTKGCKVLKIPCAVKNIAGMQRGDELLFDLQNDPHEEHPLHDAAVTARLKAAIVALLQENDAPKEIYNSYDLWFN